MSVKYNDIEKIVHKLLELNYMISFMEGCSGGALSDAFTNIKGCSNVLGFSAVCYTNEAKIALGVNPRTIEKYSEHSIQVSKEMAKAIIKFSNNHIGVGITGNIGLNYNERNVNREVYISIYHRETKQIFTKVITIKAKNRVSAKEAIVNFIAHELMNILAIN